MVTVPPAIGKVTALAFDNSLTSGRTRILRRSGDSTVGMKARLTPYCLYSTVRALLLFEAATGTGNSPPARNDATSPDWAVRFGDGKGGFGASTLTVFDTHYSNSSTFFRFADINGDGKLDSLYFTVSGSRTWAVRLVKTTDVPVDTAASIVNSAGNGS